MAPGSWGNGRLQGSFDHRVYKTGISGLANSSYIPDYAVVAINFSANGFLRIHMRRLRISGVIYNNPFKKSLASFAKLQIPSSTPLCRTTDTKGVVGLCQGFSWSRIYFKSCSVTHNGYIDLI